MKGVIHMSDNKNFLNDQELEKVNGGYTTKVVKVVYGFTAGETFEDGTYRYIVTRTVSDVEENGGVPVRIMSLKNPGYTYESTATPAYLINNCREV